MKTVLGIFAALWITASPALAGWGHSELPPFPSLVCEGNGMELKVEIQPEGAALIQSGAFSWVGKWQSTLEDEGTRLSGYHHLHIAAKDAGGKETFSLSTTYGPLGNPSGGWLELNGASGSVDCKVPVLEKASACTVAPQNDCSVSAKRLRCDCVNGQMQCS